jgi:energy-coupling factor transporter ATP-binding protein EcfA2
MDSLSPPETTRILAPFGYVRIVDFVGGLDMGKVVCSGRYSQSLSPCIDFDVHLGLISEEISESYRSRMFRRGQYLGHHVGIPGEVACTADLLQIRLLTCAVDAYRKVFWNYALKILLTIRAIQAGALHLKCVTVANSQSQGALLVGRGGSGKSTLACKLARVGLHTLGNTHAIISAARAWALPTWVRERDGETDRYSTMPMPPVSNDCELRAIVIVNHNANGDCFVDRCAVSQVLGFLRQFACAIGAYDLKEDIADVAGDFNSASGALASANASLDLLVASVPVYFLSVDAYQTASFQRASAFMLELLE